MPTPTGSETIGEALTRMRAELARVRGAIERATDNGASFSMGGVSVSMIAQERLYEREARLMREIRSLEARLAGADTGNVTVLGVSSDSQ